MNSERAEIFFNQGKEFYSQGLYKEAADKYAAAWQIWEVDLAHCSELHADRAKVMVKWADTLDSQMNYEEAANKYAGAWQILGVDLAHRSELHANRATLLTNWANTLDAQAHYKEAADKYAAAWQILGVDLAHRLELHADRAKVLMNWAGTLDSQAQYEQAADKYAAAWQIWGEDLAHRPELHADRAKVLVNWAITLDVQAHYKEAADKYAAAWQILGVDLAHRPELHGDRATLLMNWAITLHSQAHYKEAADKCAAAWQIWGVDLAHRSEFHADRARLLMNWAVTLDVQAHYEEAADKYADAWKIWGVDLAHRSDLHADRATLLMNWALTLDAQAHYKEAADKYAAAWQIKGVDLAHRLELHADRARLLMNWAGTLQGQAHYKEAADKYTAAWKIWGVDLAHRSDLHADRATLLMNWANTLDFQAHYKEAADKCEAAWQIWGVDLAHRSELHANRAGLLMNWAVTLHSQAHYEEAADKYAAAWQIMGVDLAHRSELHANRATLLTNWANTLDAQAHYKEAADKYAAAWQIRGVELAHSPELHADRATLLTNWALTLDAQAHYKKAADKCAAAWQIWGLELAQRPDITLNLSQLALNWQLIWSHAEDAQVQVERVSAELCRRLADLNFATPPDWLNGLYQRFALFHLRWMHECLENGQPEILVNVLSRVSSWRMATALNDELDSMAPAADGDANANVLQDYQRMRLELERLRQRLQEKENQAGFRGTDFSDNRSVGRDEHQLSPEVQARLKEEADILRAEYDQAYNQMQSAKIEAAKVPGYEALAMDRHVLDSQKLLAELKKGQAILIVFDHQATGDKSDETEQLNGALLLKDGEVHWHPIDDMAQGSAFLSEFEELLKNKRAGGMRGSGGEDNDIGLSGSNGFEPVYGDFRRGDVRSTDEQEERVPLVYRGRVIDRENLWKLFGDWVEDTVWKPLKQRGLLDGVQELALVTQGQEAHAIPLQMRAPVPSTSIRRYPGLMFYAMATKHMSRADCSNEPMMGIAHYQGVEKPLPFARIEAHILGQIWAESKRTTVQEFDYLQPQANAGYVHVAGHGTHAHNVEKQTATAGLSVGKNTYWGLSQLMNSPSRPKEVYLSCCVAGRTTDLAGEQYGVTSALLQHGTREVVASNVSLSDMWGSTLSIAAHSLMQQDKLSMREALHQAQLMLTGEREWDPAAWEWVKQAFAIRLDEMESIGELLQKQITPLLDKLQRETASMRSDSILAKQLGGEMRETMYFPQLSLLQFDYSKLFGWVKAVASELRKHNGQADESMLRSIVQHHRAAFLETLTWVDKAPTLIGGSLAYATVVYG